MCGGGAGTGVLEEESDERDYRTWRTFGGWCGNFLVSFWLILVRTPSKGGYGVSNVHLLYLSKASSGGTSLHYLSCWQRWSHEDLQTNQADASMEYGAIAEELIQASQCM